MDFAGLIDFTKYTLALAAAGFVYTLEKFVPMPTSTGRWFVLVVLLIFFSSAVLGALIFAMSTAALHADHKAADDKAADDKARKAAARKKWISEQIPRLGTAHSVLLFVGLVALGGLLLPRVLSAPEPSVRQPCCCTETPKG